MKGVDANHNPRAHPVCVFVVVLTVLFGTRNTSSRRVVVVVVAHRFIFEVPVVDSAPYCPPLVPQSGRRHELIRSSLSRPMPPNREFGLTRKARPSVPLQAFFFFLLRFLPPVAVTCLTKKKSTVSTRNREESVPRRGGVVPLTRSVHTSSTCLLATASVLLTTHTLADTQTRSPPLSPSSPPGLTRLPLLFSPLHLP